MGSSSLTRSGNPGSLPWEHGVLATGPPGKSPATAFCHEGTHCQSRTPKCGLPSVSKPCPAAHSTNHCLPPTLLLPPSHFHPNPHCMVPANISAKSHRATNRPVCISHSFISPFICAFLQLLIQQLFILHLSRRLLLHPGTAGVIQATSLVRGTSAEWRRET